MTVDYGERARLGVGVPQANPTVEPEMALLTPSDIATYSVRLCSGANQPAERLVEYLEELPVTLCRFDALKLDGFGFACTGSAYLTGAEREAEVVESLSHQLGYPICTATGSIKRVLSALGVLRIALVAPYPADLREAGRRYWEKQDIQVVHEFGINIGQADTRAIYELSSADAASGLRDVDTDDVDAVLLSGTGMPSLRALIAHDLSIPVISSNACLAWDLMDRIGAHEPVETWFGPSAPWVSRLPRLRA